MKTSYLKHDAHWITGLYHFLLPVVQWKYVKSFSVGGIILTPANYDKFKVTVKSVLPSGVLCAAVNGHAIQEFILVTDKPEKLVARLGQLAVCS